MKEVSRNLVAKYQRQFNQAKVYRDKKKQLKKGYAKHRDNYKDQSPLLINYFKPIMIN